MGVRAARRAFFSYTTEPEGSYSIHRVFIRFLEVNRMDMGQAEKPKAAAFLTDYILLRIYVAKYVLAGYAETYAPLLDLFRGFEKVEKKFSLFMERETAPGHGAERKFLPPDLRRRYDERGIHHFCHCRCDLRPYRGRLKIVLRLFLKYGILGAAIRGA